MQTILVFIILLAVLAFGIWAVTISSQEKPASSDKNEKTPPAKKPGGKKKK